MIAADIVIVHEAELVSPHKSGGRIRAYCHLHGGDHQRSLSIAADPADDAAGNGICHQCGVKVFVPELAPPEKAHRTWRLRRMTAEALLRPVQRPVPKTPSPKTWQRHELTTLQRLDERMRARLADARSRAYLAERGIPFEIAAACGAGYIPADANLTGVLAKWCDRLIFPLASPVGAGYAGRSLHLWEPGMDENAHKALLDALAEHDERQAEAARVWGVHATPVLHRRWEKTHPSGWFGYETLATAEHVVICEGPVDRLALLAAGLLDVTVVALVGTAARAEWIPPNVSLAVLALDGDDAGQKRARELRQELRAAGLDVTMCLPPAVDGHGKDWAERWRLAGHAGVADVVDAVDAVGLPTTLEPLEADNQLSHEMLTDLAGEVCEALAAAANVDDLEARDDQKEVEPWHTDTVVRFLLGRRFTLANAHLLDAMLE